MGNWECTILQIFDHMIDESVDWMVVVEIGSHCSSKGEDKTFFRISRDHMINESCDLVGEIAYPKSKITKICMYYNLGQACVTNWGSLVLLQIREKVVTNSCSSIITNSGSSIIANWVTVVTNWGSYYKLEQPLLQNRAAITNWAKNYTNWGKYYKLVLAIITNRSITRAIYI